jgi:hypothetical protein
MFRMVEWGPTPAMSHVDPPTGIRIAKAVPSWRSGPYHYAIHFMPLSRKLAKAESRCGR